MATLVFTVPVALRLSLLPGPQNTYLIPLVDKMLLILKHLEKQVELPKSVPSWMHPKGPSLLPPHHASTLHQPPKFESYARIWGQAVEALWRITMTFEQKTSTWDALTQRLLLWRAIEGQDGSATGEWARKEVVRGM